MPRNYLIFLILLVIVITPGTICTADVSKVYYNGYAFDPDFVPSGMIPYEAGWSHGALFSAPNWLLEHINPDEMSTVLDRRFTPVPTEVPQDYDACIAEGYAALKAGNYRDAYAAFLKAKEIKPTSADAWYGMSIALEKQNRYLSSLDAYTQAIADSHGASSNWASYAGKGRVLYALHRHSEAKFALETAIAQYEKTGISYSNEREELNKLLKVINQKIGNQNTVFYSAYIPPMFSGNNK